MAVVINEFEVVAEQRSTPRGGGEPAAEPPQAEAIEPSALAEALRTLELQALRVWAH